jgi:hypothetical protein
MAIERTSTNQSVGAKDLRQEVSKEPPSFNMRLPPPTDGLFKKAGPVKKRIVVKPPPRQSLPSTGSEEVTQKLPASATYVRAEHAKLPWHLGGFGSPPALATPQGKKLRLPGADPNEKAADVYRLPTYHLGLKDIEALEAAALKPPIDEKT